MIPWLLLHWHRFRAWRHTRFALRHYGEARRQQTLGHRHHDLATDHGAAADSIRPPREWALRLWQRGEHTDLHPPPGA